MAKIISEIAGKSFSGNGSRLISQFMEKTSESLYKKLVAFGEHSQLDGLNDNIFCYQERQIKGQIAAALDNICRGYFMQEPPVKRKAAQHKENEGEDSGGWCDFWCRFGETKKIDVLIEVKHWWIRFYCKKEPTFYKRGVQLHRNALKQIHKIKKKDYINGHLFGAALSVVPIFIRYANENETPLAMNDELLKEVLVDAMKKSGARFGYIKGVPEKLNKIAECQNSKGNVIYESYPAILLLWSVNKITRDHN